MVTTTDSTVPSAEWIGVALTRVVTVRPSGTESSISSARMVSALLSSRDSGNWPRAISRPSASRHVITCSNCSGGSPGVRRTPDDALCLPVERERRAGPGIEDHDADR